MTETNAAKADYRVLLVEDNRDSVALVRAFLKDPFIDITVSMDGEQGVAAFKESLFDLVLMDIQMPVLDGLAATEAIRRWEIENCRPRTPIAALTASTETSELSRMFSSGCSSYLPKPVTKAMLIQAINQLSWTKQ